MHVQVKDGLSGTWPDIEDRPISLFNLALSGDLSRGKMTPADHLGL